MKYDLIVIGGGIAGHTASIKASKLNKKVLLIEKHSLGGRYVNSGSISARIMLDISNQLLNICELHDKGLNFLDVNIEEDKIIENCNKVSEELRDKLEQELKENKVTVLYGEGKILTETAVEVEGKIYNTKKILVATGTKLGNLKTPGFKNARSSEEFFKTGSIGNDIAIIGGGVIGVEIATFLMSIGKNVTLFEKQERLVSDFSREISVQLATTLRRKSVDVLTNALVCDITPDHRVIYEIDGEAKEKQFSDVIYSVGRVPNVKNLGLKDLKIEMDGEYIKVDEDFKTSIPSIYAVGDIVGKTNVAHFVETSSEIAVLKMFRKGEYKNSELSLVPKCIYTIPEIAVIGKTELSEDIKMVKYDMDNNGSAVLIGKSRGYIKLFADKNILVGAELYCVSATEIINEISLAIANKIRIKEIVSTIHPQPTVGASFKDACKLFLKRG